MFGFAMTERIDFYQYILQELKQIQRYFGEVEHIFREENQLCTDRKKSFTC